MFELGTYRKIIGDGTQLQKRDKTNFKQLNPQTEDPDRIEHSRIRRLGKGFTVSVCVWLVRERERVQSKSKFGERTEDKII